MFRISFYLLFLFLLTNSCNPQLTKRYVREVGSMATADIPADYPSPKGKTPCNDRLNYAPDPAHLEYTPKKKVKINLHFMSNGKGEGGITDKKYPDFGGGLVWFTNKYLRTNHPMTLPVGNKTPVLPLLYDYALTPDPDIPGDTGIYFHQDDDLYYMNAKHSTDRNISDRRVYEKYGVQKGKVLNVFFMEHQLDSLASPTYQTESNGISFGNWVKILGTHVAVLDTTFKADGSFLISGYYRQARLIIHEIGHSLGVSHSWIKNDGCEDTPPHHSCYGETKNPPCNFPASNNFMDYVAVPIAATPCQIGTIHKNISNKNHAIRQVVQKTWCNFDKEKTIEITEPTIWNGAKDLQGHVVVMDGATLTLQCRLALPKGAKIIIYPKGRLILDGATLENDCDEQWAGIETWKFGKDQGQVTYLNSPTINNAINDVVVK